MFYLFEKGHRKKLDELAEVLVEQDLHIGWIKRWDLMLGSTFVVRLMLTGQPTNQFI